MGYLYLRKAQSKSEAMKTVGRGQFFVVNKHQLAQAVAGSDLDPWIVRSGREKLFTEEHYGQAFPNSDPDYFLPRYRLMPRSLMQHEDSLRGVMPSGLS